MVRAHKRLPALGLCRLCRQPRELERSHVHSRLAYRRFASDAPGTPFIDLAEMSRHNRQLQRRWFCRSCEAKFEHDGETPIASWLDRVDSLAQSEYEYGPFLHSFAASLVYRYCLLELEDGDPPTSNRALLTEPMHAWRELLLRKKATGIYTLHGFLIPADQENGPWEAA